MADSLLVACGDRAPFFQPGPQPLDLVAVRVDPGRTGQRFLVPAGRDHRACTQAPDVLTKSMAAVAPVGNHPFRHARELP